MPLWRYRPHTAPTGDTAALGSLASLPARFSHLHVLGLGVPAADVPLLPPGVQLVAHPSSAAFVFTAAEWPQQLPLGETLRLQGYLRGNGTRPVQVRLYAAGRPHDSVQVPADGGAFVLRYQPRYTGRQLLRLEARQGAQLLASEPVPVQVLPARRLRVLLVAGSPSFELNLLKNHLASQGHQVALRLRLSPSLLQTDLQNQPATDLSGLTTRTLARFDAVVADADALTSLPAPEIRALTAATINGLGLLLIGATELPRTLPGRASFALQPRPAALAEQPQLIRWDDHQASATLPTLLRPTPATRPLVTGPGGAPVAASCRVGWGSVGVATPASTYQWLLSGATGRYAAYWRTLLGAAARPLEPVARWSTPRWPRPDEPQLLQLLAPTPPTRAQAGPVASDSTGTNQLPLRQHPAQAELWQAPYWPAHAGWHRVAARLDTSYFYVFGSADWRGPLQTERLAAAVRYPAGSAGSARGAATRTKPWLAAGWFMALFVVAAGWLWLDEKR